MKDSFTRDVALTIEQLRMKITMGPLIVYVQPMTGNLPTTEFVDEARKWGLVVDKLNEIHTILGTTPNYKVQVEKLLQQADGRSIDN